MAPQGAAPKRNRRSRKRRRADSYEVSSDSDSDASSSSPVKASKAASAVKSSDKMDVDGAGSASSSSDSSDSESDGSDSSDSSDEDSDDSSSSSSSSSAVSGKGKGKARASAAAPVEDEVRARKRIPGIRDNSPTPEPVAIPGFFASAAGTDGDGGQDRRSQFRKVYMEKLVEGFGSDLDKLRTSDPTMNPARLKRLIAGLQEAATLYENSNTASGQDGKVDEMSVVLGV